MLTVDLVQVRRRGDRLLVPQLDARRREEARSLAERYLALTEQAVGGTRDELMARWAEVDVPAHLHKLASGLQKLIEDRCELAMEPGVDPPALRLEVFRRASALRRSLACTERFDRDAVLAEVGAAHGLTPAELERQLYADLAGAHQLLSFRTLSAEALVEAYELGQAQAVLLRALSVTADVWAAQAGSYRALFRRLKFLRLLHVLRPLPDGGYRLEVDGPLSLFGPVMRYGLQLALLLPALQECGRFRLDAEVLWGKDRQRLKFTVEGGGRRSPPRGEPVAGSAEPRLPDEVESLLQQFRALDTPWDAAPCTQILELPGVGLCVPDLVFTRRDTGEQVFLEVLGYWSRAAVWRRVELVQAGLPFRILFAVSSRLRVSEAALDGDLPGELYVYKGVINARRIAERLERDTE